MPSSRFLLALATAGLVTAVRAEPTPVPPVPRASLTDAVREAVSSKKVEDSDNFKDRAARVPFRDVAADGAVLVGLEVGLAKSFGQDIPYSIRPIYRRGAREWTGGTAGNFGAREVKRTVRVVAKEGYAVGGMWVRSGGAMDRLCLVYVAVREGGLDPADNYTSAWVGSSDGGTDHYIDGRGQPVVGLLADTNRGQARSLGLVYARVPPIKKPEPKPEPKQPLAEPAAPPADPDAAAAAAKPGLQLEAPTADDESNDLALVLLALCGAVGIPAGVVGVMAFGKRERMPPTRPADPRRRSPVDESAAVKPKAEAKAAAARPELARRLQPYMPATVATDADQGVVGGETLPYFMVRATYRARRERMTRVYILPGELLIIDAGPGSDVNQAAGLAAAAVTGGGIIGALVGGAVGGMVADAQKAKGEALQQRLNRLDLAGLLEWAGEDGNFRARVEDLVGVAVDPPAASLWREATRGVGTFRFRDLKRGEFTFEFLSGAEVRGAVELLRRVLGPALQVGSGWDDATAVYLAGL